MSSSSIRSLCQIALFAAIIAVCSQIQNSADCTLYHADLCRVQCTCHSGRQKRNNFHLDLHRSRCNRYSCICRFLRRYRGSIRNDWRLYLRFPVLRSALLADYAFPRNKIAGYDCSNGSWFDCLLYIRNSLVHSSLYQQGGIHWTDGCSGLVCIPVYPAGLRKDCTGNSHCKAVAKTVRLSRRCYKKRCSRINSAPIMGFVPAFFADMVTVPTSPNI